MFEDGEEIAVGSDGYGDEDGNDWDSGDIGGNGHY